MTAYTEQWSRVAALFKAGRIPSVDFITLAARHDKWFAEQRRSDATLFMVQDLQRYADHIEQFETEMA